MEYKFIKTSTFENVALLELNRPDKMNALCIEMVEELNHYFNSIPLSTYALIITGQTDFFCAGGDLKEMQGLTEREAQRRSTYVQNTFKLIHKFPFPVVSIISGYCLGGGLELALHSDYRIAANNARLAFPEVKYGMIPGAGGTVLLGEYMPASDALYYLTTCENIPLEKAVVCGLIQKLFNENELAVEIKKQVEYFNKTNPDAVKSVKLIQKSKAENNLTHIYELEANEFAQLLFNNGRSGIQNNFKQQ